MKLEDGELVKPDDHGRPSELLNPVGMLPDVFDNGNGGMVGVKYGLVPLMVPLPMGEFNVEF